MSTGVDKYQVEGAFEATVIYYLVEDRGFATHFLPHIKEELFTSPYATRVVDVLLDYFKQYGRALTTRQAVAHQISQLYNKGKILARDKRDTIEYLDEASMMVTGDEEDTFSQFAELVRDWKHYLATKAAINLQMNRKSISEVADLILEADSIVKRKETTHTVGGADDFQRWANVIMRSGLHERDETGVDIWDTYLDGGLVRKGLLLIIGSTGAGKSMLLSQLCASCLIRGKDAVYISLEVEDGQVASRIFAPLAGLPIDFVVKRTPAVEPYLEKTWRRTGIKPGRLYIEEFPAGVTVHECLSAVKKKLEKAGIKAKRFFIDYLDRFGSSADGGYAEGKVVTDALKNFAKSVDGWVFTAAQSKRFNAKGQQKESDENSVADSMHKVRIADVVINLLLNRDGPNGDEVSSRISKDRAGKATGKKTDYIPLDYTYGVVFPSNDFKLLRMEQLETDPNFADLIAADKKKDALEVQQKSRRKR